MVGAPEALVLDSIDPLSPLGVQWEKLVRCNQASGVMQSLHWAEFKRKQGLLVFHVGVFQGDEIIGGAIFYRSPKRTGVGILIAPEGPVLPWDQEALATSALGLIIDIAQLHAGDLGVMSMRIEPRLKLPKHPVLREFGSAPADLMPKDTLCIDLTQPEGSLLSSMKPKARYNINLAQRHGVTVAEDTTSGALHRFYAAMMEASSRNAFAVEPLQFFENLVSVMQPTQSAKLLFAEHEGTTLGTMLLISYGARGTYLYGGTTDQKRNLMGGYALQWEAMKLAKAQGCETYDFYGIDPFRMPQHPYARFSQFKSQFGGNVERFIGAQDYFFLDNVADAFIRIVNQTLVHSH